MKTGLDISKLVHMELKQNSLVLVAHINGAYVDLALCMSCVLKNWPVFKFRLMWHIICVTVMAVLGC